MSRVDPDTNAPHESAADLPASRARRWWRPSAWLWLSALAGGALLTGLVPLHGSGSLTQIWHRVDHVLIFLVAVTVVAELCQVCGVFDAMARLTARASRGRTALLFCGVVVVGSLSTITLSLDTTAVLLTPVVLTLCLSARIDPMPFALLVIWLANAGSLLLPVSNLTNLLAADVLGLSTTQFAALMLAPALCAITVPAAALAVRHARSLRGRFHVTESRVVTTERRVFIPAVVIVSIMVTAFAAGAPVHWAASIAAVLLVLLVAALKTDLLSWRMVPWRLAVMTMALFVVMTAVTEQGGSTVAEWLVADDHGLGGLLQTAATGMGVSNAVNNLPAYLALETPAAESGRLSVLALLIGVNAGATITPFASLATLLWWDRCRAAGVHIKTQSFVLLGLVVAPTTVIAATTSLWAVSR